MWDVRCGWERLRKVRGDIDQLEREEHDFKSSC